MKKFYFLFFLTFYFLFFLPQFKVIYAQTPGTYSCNWFGEACRLNDEDINSSTCSPGEYNLQNCQDFTSQGEAVCNSQSFPCTPPPEPPEPPPDEPLDFTQTGYYICEWDPENQECFTYSPNTWGGCNTGYQTGNGCGSLSLTDCQSTQLPCEVNYACGQAGQACCVGNTCSVGSPTLINNGNTCICTTSIITGSIHCEGQNTINTAIGCIKYDDINAFAIFITLWGAGIASGIAFLLLIRAGFLYMTARGDDAKLAEARQISSAAISAVVYLILSAYIIRLLGKFLIDMNFFN